MQKTETTERQDVHTRITAQIVADLAKGVRPWVKPWNTEHAAGRITRPLRHNGQPNSGINILSLWMSATVQNFAAPIWMTFRQALELDAHVRKGEKGSLVVYANSISRTELAGTSNFKAKYAGNFPKVAIIDAAPGPHDNAGSTRIPRLSCSRRSRPHRGSLQTLQQSQPLGS